MSAAPSTFGQPVQASSSPKPFAGLEHGNVRCDACNACPIRGPRFKCGNCVDYDLCGQCMQRRASVHDASHCFLYVDQYLPLVATNPPLLSQTLFATAADPQASPTTAAPAFALDTEPRILVEKTSFASHHAVKTLVEFVETIASNEWENMTVSMMENNDLATTLARVSDPSLRICSKFKGQPPKLVLSPLDQEQMERMVGNATEMNQHSLPATAAASQQSSAPIHVWETELMLYRVGSHFGSHQDRDRVDSANGTQVGVLLLIGFSPDAQGGDLSCEGQVVVSKRDTTNHSNPPSAPLQQQQQQQQEWQWFSCFIPRGKTHRVHPLMNGFRIVYKQILYRVGSPSAFGATNPSAARTYRRPVVRRPRRKVQPGHPGAFYCD